MHASFGCSFHASIKSNHTSKYFRSLYLKLIGWKLDIVLSMYMPVCSVALHFFNPSYVLILVYVYSLNLNQRKFADSQL